MPKPWAEMVETHRRHVRGAILDAAAALVTEHGLRAVTMAQIADRAGIARATVSRYFSDVDAIMRAWHDRQIANHLAYLDDVRDQSGDPVAGLDAVLRAYAMIVDQTHEHRTTELGALLHRDERLVQAQRHLHDMIRSLLAEGAKSGAIRDDVPPAELADHCLHTLSAAGGQPSAAAIRQLVTATLAGLRHP